MEWLTYFVMGWFGYHWLGEKVDAPNPKDPHPWELVAGIVGGVAAIFVVRATNMSDVLPAMLLSIGTGVVVGRVLNTGMKMMGK